MIVSNLTNPQYLNRLFLDYHIYDVNDLRKKISNHEKVNIDNIILFNSDRHIPISHNKLLLSNYDESKWIYHIKKHITIKNEINNTVITKIFDNNQIININKLLNEIDYQKSYMFQIKYDGIIYKYNNNEENSIKLTSCPTMIININSDLFSIIKIKVDTFGDQNIRKNIIAKKESKIIDIFNENNITLRYDNENYKIFADGNNANINSNLNNTKYIKAVLYIPDGSCILKGNGIHRIVRLNDICDKDYLMCNGIQMINKKYADFVKDSCINVTTCLINRDNALLKLYILTIIGKKMEFFVNPTDDVFCLKLLIQQQNDTNIDMQRLIFASRQLNDNKTFTELNIQNESSIHLVLRLRGGGNDFIDVTNKNKREKSDWSNKAPKWRTADLGLGLMGLCQNIECKAYNEYVLYNHGIRQFCLDDLEKVKCPQCEKNIKPSTLTLNNCCWRFEGIKTSNPTNLIKTEWETIGNHIIKYDKDMTGTVSWDFLNIDIRGSNSKMRPDKIFCSICIEHNENKCDIMTLDCNHIFHKQCLDGWLKINRSCPLCRKTVK